MAPSKKNKTLKIRDLLNSLHNTKQRAIGYRLHWHTVHTSSSLHTPSCALIWKTRDGKTNANPTHLSPPIQMCQIHSAEEEESVPRGTPLRATETLSTFMCKRDGISGGGGGVVYPSVSVSLSFFGAGSSALREAAGLERPTATVVPERR